MGLTSITMALNKSYLTKMMKRLIDNIAGTNKNTRSGRILSPEISPPVQVTITKTTAEDRGKESMIEPAGTEAPKEATLKDTSGQELEEVLKIIRKSEYKIVEQLGQTPSKIYMLSLLLCSEAHVKPLVEFLKTSYVPQEISADQFGSSWLV